ncbi:MAG: hypothetical protein PVF83_08705 [Anaerolineales bacterium]|jgi:hypothetical protein
MTYQEKNIVISLCSQILILAFFLIRIFQIFQDGALEPGEVFWLWGTVIILQIVVTIVGVIAMHVLSAVIESVKNNGTEPQIDDVQDERDKLISLKGTRVAYYASSIGIVLSMLSLVFGQPALVMFSLLIFSGIAAQIIEDVSKLTLYRRGF